MAQTPSLTKRHANLQQRSILSTSSFSLKLWVLLGPEEYVEPPNAPILIPVAAPMAYRERMGEILTDA